MFLTKDQALDWLVKNQESWPTEFPSGQPRGLAWWSNRTGYVASWCTDIKDAVTEKDWLEAKEPKTLVQRLTALHANTPDMSQDLIAEAIKALTWTEVDHLGQVPEGEWLGRKASGRVVQVIREAPSEGECFAITGPDCIKAYMGIPA